MVALKHDLSRGVAVDAEVLVLGLSIPLDVNVHVIGTSLEVLELNECVSQSIWTHFLLTMTHHFKVVLVQILQVSVKISRVLHSAESNVDSSCVIIQIKVHTISFFGPASLLGDSKGSKAIAVLWNSKFNQRIPSMRSLDWHERVDSVIVNFADINLVKNSDHIFKKHPEDTIVGI